MSINAEIRPTIWRRNADHARRQLERARAARANGDWETEVADATTCYEKVSFAFDEIVTVLGSPGSGSTHPATRPVPPGAGCARWACSKIERGDWAASVLAYELNEPHGTWQAELHELFTHLRHPNVHGGADFAAPQAHPAGVNLHPLYARASVETATSYVELLEDLVKRLGSRLA